MKKYELLKQYQMEAAKLQLEKERAIEIVKELCEEWNLTFSNKEEQIINNIITINKGKIVAVENNELQEAYDVLAANFNNRCKRVAELQAQYDKLDQEYTDFQAEYTAAINKRDEQIDDLKDELQIKEALIYNLKARLAVAEEELEERQRKEVVKYEHFEVVDDPLYNESVEEEEEVEEESDAMPLFNIPEEYKDKPEIEEIVKRKTDEYNNAKEIMLSGQMIHTKEEMQEDIIKQANKEIEITVVELQKIEKYAINYTTHEGKNGGIVSVEGTLMLNGEERYFKYGATHKLPYILGCFSEEELKEAKDALDKTIHLIKDETEEKHMYEVTYAFDKGIVVYQENDGCFKGYIRNPHNQSGGAMAFTWDGISAQPCGRTARDEITNYKEKKGQKMTQITLDGGRNKGQIKLAKEFMAFCETTDKHFCRTTDKDTKTTKEIKQVTEEEVIIETNEEKLNVSDDIANFDA